MKTKTKTKAKLSDLKSYGVSEPGADAVTFGTAHTGAAPAPVKVPDEFKIVPRDKVRPDPNQPRKEFNQGKLKELAESIRTNGIIQPIIVQLVPAELKIIEQDFANDHKWQAVNLAGGAVVFESVNEIAVTTFAKFRTEDFYQIVDGERRWRAAGIADLGEVPVLVRSIEAHKVFAAQWTSNQARENLSVLEEGKAFARTIEERQKSNAKFSKDDLAAELGIARGTVYNRITLTRLTPAVTEALTAGKIQPTVAGLIAMIPDPKRQEELLKEITNENDWEYPFSFRDVQETIDRDYLKQLKDAPFDTKSATVLQDAVMVKSKWQLNGAPLEGDLCFGPCETCQHRSGNMVADFPHIKNLQSCTNVQCFEAKTEAHYALMVQEAQTAGKTVLTEKELKASNGKYVEANDYCKSQGDYYTSWEKAMGKKAPDPVLVVTKNGVKEVYARDQAKEAAKKNGYKFELPPAEKKRRAEQEENSANEEKREALAVELLPDLAKGIARCKDKDAFEIISELLEACSGYPDHDRLKQLVGKTSTPKEKALGRLLADEEIHPVSYDGAWSEYAAVWKRLGVDLVAEEKKRADTLPLKKAEAQQKELLAVKKNRKKVAAPRAK